MKKKTFKPKVTITFGKGLFNGLLKRERKFYDFGKAIKFAEDMVKKMEELK